MIFTSQTLFAVCFIFGRPEDQKQHFFYRSTSDLTQPRSLAHLLPVVALSCAQVSAVHSIIAGVGRRPAELRCWLEESLYTTIELTNPSSYRFDRRRGLAIRDFSLPRFNRIPLNYIPVYQTPSRSAVGRKASCRNDSNGFSNPTLLPNPRKGSLQLLCAG